MRRFLLLLMLLGAIKTQAQFGYSPPTTIQTPRGNVTIPGTYSYVPMYYLGPRNLPLKKYDYTIVLKNDSLEHGHGKIVLKKGVVSLSVKNSDKQNKEYTPAQTKEIYILNQYGAKIQGRPAFNDSIWLFKIHRGPINLYAIAPEQETKFYSAIQKGDNGPIVPLSKENLLPMVSDNAEATKQASKGKLSKAIEIYDSIYD